MSRPNRPIGMRFWPFLVPADARRRAGGARRSARSAARTNGLPVFGQIHRKAGTPFYGEGQDRGLTQNDLRPP